jgi:hypothetical protein
VVRVSDRPDGRRILFRAAGSAGARFPLELYVAVPEGVALPPGVHWYHPEQHALVQVGPAPRAGAPLLVMTGVPWRTGWRYRERGYRHIYWDAGTALSQSLALADSAGVPAHLFTRFPDELIADLVGARLPHEFPVAVMALGEDGPQVAPSGPAEPGIVDSRPVELPLVTAAQRAGASSSFGPAWPPGAAVRPASSEMTLDEVILRRGSQRLLDPTGTLPRSTLTAAMSAAMRGIEVPHWVVVHAVEDVQPGLYRWPDLDAVLRGGDLRAEMYRVCMEQELPAEACFVAISAADLATVSDRGYREAQLAAGLVEGRLHLMAYALGAAASGMTFYDSAIPGLLGADLGGLLFTCVGVPEYRSRRAGAPGRPSSIRGVVPRMDDR